MWDRLTAEGRQVIRYAHAEAAAFGHQLGRYPWTYSYIGDEHVLLGILRHGDSAAARLLREHGLELAEARERLRRIGPVLRPHVDGGEAQRAFGVDPEALRRRLQESFGGEAVAAAERRVRHRPWWRDGLGPPVHLPAGQTCLRHGRRPRQAPGRGWRRARAPAVRGAGRRA
ncbi:Clp protease N-terminal domain-containing protein [Nonomuraea sp. NPDC046570]|uniref:Clp protease N-terminal domain-containing protein n=1 Tax=Nonomuraea sp. NPDC046570 TaxID=3155255 RepID=UPI0033D1D59F